MTREETKQAIEGFAQFFRAITGDQELEIPKDIKERFDIQDSCDKNTSMAIKALEQEPCEDAISRQMINDLQKYRYNCGETSIICVSLGDVNELPSVNPQEPKTGHWKSTIDGKPICSECDFISESLDGYFVSNYCPNCGKKMEEQDADSN